MSPLALLDACFETLKPTLTFLFRRQFKLLFAYDASDGLNPHGVTQVSFHLTFDSQKAPLLTAWSACCAAWLRVLKHIGKLWVQAPCFSHSVVQGWKKGLALLATNQPGKQACVFKEWASPLWFTAPTETKLGTATVSAPGPLSSSQDELFAEDIQMYKEQIRLTQSSFAWRERKKEREPADFKKTSFPQLFEWVKGPGNENSLVYSKC